MSAYSSTVENYVRAIYLRHRDSSGMYLPMGQIAEAMDVSPGTATSMMKTLAVLGLIEYSPRNGSRLTGQGESLALDVLRRHRLVELFLVEVLGLDWSEVHCEADNLEHAISDVVLTRVDALLNHPTVDPHGDPIPTRRGQIDQTVFGSLMEQVANVELRIERVTDQSPEFLQFVRRSGLHPGNQVIVESIDRAADAVTLETERGIVTIGTQAASKILARPLESDSSSLDPSPPRLPG